MQVDWKVAYLGILKGLSAGFRLSGMSARAAALDNLIEGIESGRRVDAHMAAVAVAVASNDPNDWDGPEGVIARINAHGEEFQKPAGSERG